MKHLICAIVMIIVMVGLALLRGVVVADLWQWFVTPFGLPAIGIVHAMGVSLFVAALTFQNAKTNIDDDVKGWTRVFTGLFIGVLINLFVWGVGALIASFM